MLRFRILSIAMVLGAACLGGAGEGWAAADVQFFGDVYLSPRALQATRTDETRPGVFAQVRDLLHEAHYNLINLEGAATQAFVPQEMKRYLLRMPLNTGKILAAAGIHVATLANNHAMDFGYQGVFDTQQNLAAAGVQTIGAGRNLDEAATPALLPLSDAKNAHVKTICVLTFSRTLPRGFWATDSKPGTARADFDEVRHRVSRCHAERYFTVAVFHWGMESSDQPLPYQTELAQTAIDAGAKLVLGHHPHNVQTMELYQGYPIIYSIGNFAFGSMPAQGVRQEGLAVQLRLGNSITAPYQLSLLPLVVRNDRVRYQPRLAQNEAEFKASTPGKPENFGCKKSTHPTTQKRHSWECLFPHKDQTKVTANGKALPLKATQQ